jgi:hypothetical protein
MQIIPQAWRGKSFQPELQINDNSSRKQRFLLTTAILLDHIH